MEHSRNELRETFDAFDRDHNGSIDFQEFLELLKALRADCDEATARVGWKVIDSDNSGTIDFEEFVTWWGDFD